LREVEVAAEFWHLVRQAKSAGIMQEEIEFLLERKYEAMSGNVELVTRGDRDAIAQSSRSEQPDFADLAASLAAKFAEILGLE
jgi:hypothetical protein